MSEHLRDVVVDAIKMLKPCVPLLLIRALKEPPFDNQTKSRRLSLQEWRKGGAFGSATNLTTDTCSGCP